MKMNETHNSKLTSYDSLFEKMPLMGELMESAGCVCALPEYCFTNYLESVEKEEVEVELWYEILFKYIEENGYKIAGSIRESYIDGVWNKENESEWLTEIQVPVI